MPLLEINNLLKRFAIPGGGTQTVVDVERFTLEPGAQVALCGESGSGKTTLLNLIAGILSPDSGSILLNGTNIATLAESARDRFRAAHIGYIFQTFNLLHGYTCLENVLLGMAFGGKPDRDRAESLLDRVGLKERISYRPRDLSTGQQQRVAVARALAGRPKLVLADEPTGNLDRANACDALRLIRESCAAEGAALLLVSHDPAVLEMFETRYDLKRLNRAAAGREVAP